MKMCAIEVSPAWAGNGKARTTYTVQPRVGGELCESVGMTNRRPRMVE